MLVYPLYLIVDLLREVRAFELIRHQGSWIGSTTTRRSFTTASFGGCSLRTIVFTAVNVSLTMVLGTAIALLLAESQQRRPHPLTTALVLVWAMPVVVAVDVWRWMVDHQFGILNWALTKLHIGDFVAPRLVRESVDRLRRVSRR